MPVECKSCGKLFQQRKGKTQITHCQPCRKKRRAKNAARAERRIRYQAATDGQ